MAIQVNGCTVIDDDRNIVNAGDIRVGLVTITGSNGNIETPGTITGAGYSVAGVGYTISPGAGTTNVSLTPNIVLSFPTSITRGTGTVTIRTDSASGTILQSYNAATSSSIVVLNNAWAISIGATTPLINGKQIFLVIPSTAITGFVGLNTTGADSYSFTTVPLGALGAAAEGGFLICKAGGTAWIVSPREAEVTRNWYARTDANTRAQTVSGCIGWFVPSCAQLQNPGYVCRDNWDCYSRSQYWSNTDFSPGGAWCVNFSTGVAYGGCPYGKTNAICVRSFRCVTY